MVAVGAAPARAVGCIRPQRGWRRCGTSERRRARRGPCLAFFCIGVVQSTCDGLTIFCRADVPTTPVNLRGCDRALLAGLGARSAIQAARVRRRPGDAVDPPGTLWQMLRCAVLECEHGFRSAEYSETVVHVLTTPKGRRGKGAAPPLAYATAALWSYRPPAQALHPPPPLPLLPAYTAKRTV